MGNIDFDVKVCDGKYTYRQYKDGSQEALRHGETWRDLCGDNLVRCLAWELNEARERIVELERERDEISALVSDESSNECFEAQAIAKHILARRDARVAADSLDDAADQIVNIMGTEDAFTANDAYKIVRDTAFDKRRQAEGGES